MIFTNKSSNILRPLVRKFSSEKRIKKIGVVGMGLMGSGIVQVSASAGYQLVAIESSKSAMDAGLKKIENFLTKSIAKEKGEQSKVI